ncbi:agamous-like MADS-box protein AGL65 [Magnolia sinica]|uniref:agamous-like MADS-box protein AGL65 n=1 Tax=Magnolia sinica TaxID=86752 RepID=UPI002657BC4E|nr:agamous-like MADS-box protein AGL65 [Magnolia sinica]
MGRVKLKIQRLETLTARQITYSKRKLGLTKKAMELSILCDIDIALVMFSPSGRPTMCVGASNELDGVLERFSMVPLHERSKRKLEVIDVLKKIFRKLDHNVDVQRLLGDGRKKIEDLHNQQKLLQAQIQEKNRKLSYWTKPEEVEDLAQIQLMEETLVESINRLQKRKVHLAEKRTHKSLSALQAQRFTWLPENHMLNARVRNDPNIAQSRRCFGNANGRTEIAGPATQLGFQHTHQQPDYNLNGYDQSKLGVDLNQSGEYYNHIQQFYPGGPYYGPSLHHRM